MKEERLAIGGAAFAAFTASLCCIGPVLSVLLGLGAFGAGAVLESARPYLLVIAALSLAFGFYRAYTRREAVCGPGEACDAKPVSRMGRGGLWISAGLVLAFALWPSYAGGLLRRLSPGIARAGAETATRKARLKVTGMTCGGCEPAVRMALEQVPGVKSAEVSYERSEALVEYDPKMTVEEKLRDAVNKIGYPAEIER